MMPLKTIDGIACCLDKLEARVANVLADTVGNATLVAGTVSVADPAVKAGSFVLLSRKTIGGTAGNLSYTVTAGTGITINSSSNTDTSTVTYLIRH